MPTNIDALMQLDPLGLSAQNLDEIIAYQRKARQSFESGVKPKKGDSGPKIDLIGHLVAAGKINVAQSSFKKRKF